MLKHQAVRIWAIPVRQTNVRMVRLNVRGTPVWSFVNAAKPINTPVRAIMKRQEPTNAATTMPLVIVMTAIYGKTALVSHPAQAVILAIFSIPITHVLQRLIMTVPKPFSELWFTSMTTVSADRLWHRGGLMRAAIKPAATQRPWPGAIMARIF